MPNHRHSPAPRLWPPTFPDVNAAMTDATRLAHQTGYRHRVWFDPGARQWKITRTRTRTGPVR